MRQIFPLGGLPAGAGADGGGGGAGELSDADLAALYAYPEGVRTVRANMVMSVDGAASLAGRSGGLSSPGDRRVFALLRGLADVVVAGAGTVRAEHYKPARPAGLEEAWPGLRAGRPATPPIAVVTRRLDLDPEDPLFTSAPPHARTIVITSGLAPGERVASFDGRADVIVADTDRVDLETAVGALAARGYQRILCEGGPHLIGDLTAAGLLGELCVTVSPLLAGPGPGRISAAMGLTEEETARPLRLAHVLHEDGFLFCRYGRA
ncbi:MAG: pyrimidine reductase family protein [Streptosporangiaceae bacterium]|nr:pyrimidine reductase family protein [Streptosporangiaceae bacterium]MBV9855723.1 pyrimidine reductase family protein [Streptosporangiaceae bacterium]